MGLRSSGYKPRTTYLKRILYLDTSSHPPFITVPSFRYLKHGRPSKNLMCSLWKFHDSKLTSHEQYTDRKGKKVSVEKFNKRVRATAFFLGRQLNHLNTILVNYASYEQNLAFTVIVPLRQTFDERTSCSTKDSEVGSELLFCLYGTSRLNCFLRYPTERCQTDNLLQLSRF